MGGPHRILIADDDFLAVVMLRDMLESVDYEVVEALNGNEALTQAELRAPDLILLDIMMPIMDGKEVCRRLKSAAATRDIPIIMLTALSSSQDIKDCFDAGAADYLIKPVEKTRLLKKIEASLKMHAFRNKIEQRSQPRTGTPETIERDVRLERKHKLRGGISQFLAQVEQSITTLRQYLARLESEGDTDPEVREVGAKLDVVSNVCAEMQQSLARKSG